MGKVGKYLPTLNNPIRYRIKVYKSFLYKTSVGSERKGDLSKVCNDTNIIMRKISEGRREKLTMCPRLILFGRRHDFLIKQRYI